MVATDEPPPRPCVEDRDATRLSRMEDLPEFRLKGADDDLYGIYQHLVNQDPGKIWMVESKRTVSGNIGGKTCLFSNPMI